MFKDQISQQIQQTFYQLPLVLELTLSQFTSLGSAADDIHTILIFVPPGTHYY